MDDRDRHDHEHGRPKADDFGEGELFEKFKELFRHQMHLFKEFEMATQGNLDALKVATDALTASTQASVAATEALIAAGSSVGSADDQAIQDATSAVTAAQTSLDAETALAQAATGTAPVQGTENFARAQAARGK